MFNTIDDYARSIATKLSNWVLQLPFWPEGAVGERRLRYVLLGLLAADPRLGQADYAALPLEQNNALSHLVKMYRERFGIEMPEKQCDENGRYFFNIRVYED